MAEAPVTVEPKGPEAARFNIRSAGYCVICDRIVEREPDGTCPKGHPAAALAGSVPLRPGDPVPSLPRFNWAAFALPPVWGPAHGQWVGVIFLPIWLFVDNALSVAGRSLGTAAVAVVIVALTLAFQAFFAKRANGVAWRRVCDRVGVEEFSRRQRLWAYACVPIGLALLAWGIYYRFVLA